MSEVSQRVKDSRAVTFLEDYHSVSGKKENAAPIYRKGETHAIDKRLVASLKEKGAKMTVKEIDHEAVIKRAKKQLSENRKNEVAQK